MYISKIEITKNTCINAMLEFMDISLEEFYYDFIAKSINNEDYYLRKLTGVEGFEIIKK